MIDDDLCKGLASAGYKRRQRFHVQRTESNTGVVLVLAPTHLPLCEDWSCGGKSSDNVSLAGLHMAQKDSLAASQTMQRAIDAKRLALGPSHPAVAESVLGLAAIHRASGNTQDAVELLQKELKFLTKEGQASTPGDLQERKFVSGTV